MELRQALLNILDGSPNEHDMVDDIYCRINKIDNGFEIEYGAMYSAPAIGFSRLVALSQLFGTEEIDVNNYCNSAGCESCGYWSDYGNTIQILNPTKKIAELDELAGQDLWENNNA